jgi:hypothetical protein
MNQNAKVISNLHPLDGPISAAFTALQLSALIFGCFLLDPSRDPAARSCAARDTVHEETEVQQVRGVLSLADTQTGC